jgi:hypothetical protein
MSQGGRTGGPEVTAASDGSSDGDEPSEPIGTSGAEAVAWTIHQFLMQTLVAIPLDGLLACGIRSHFVGRPLSLQLNRSMLSVFRIMDRTMAGSHLVMEVSQIDAATSINPFYDTGVLQYFILAGGFFPSASSPPPKLVAAAIW